MPDVIQQSLRRDSLDSLDSLKGLAGRLTGQCISVIGGTGFVGTWLAEAVAALNDDMGGNVRIDLLGRRGVAWYDANPHLRRDDITVRQVDVRSPFELARDTTLVLFAAGIADPRVHAFDPHQVFQTTVHGIGHALAVASRLELIQRFVNFSSGLVAGDSQSQDGLKEHDVGVLEFTRFHNVYAESRRAAESLAAIYAGQYRIPVSTARAFTFVGPYQALDAPYALNNFMRDALAGKDIRIHGDGGTRRSYLYGSDVAAWLLKLFVDGRDGEAYNIGGEQPISHSNVALQIASITTPTPSLVHRSQPNAGGRNHDFFPDVRHTMNALGVRQIFSTDAAIERSMRWNAQRLGVLRRLRGDVATQ